VPLAEDELRRLWERSVTWAEGNPLILGGDLNLRSPLAPDTAIAHVAARDVDHVFACGLMPVGNAELLDRHVGVRRVAVELSDHPALRARVQPTPSSSLP
jgi:endonuclease/exonuclease/phosphatase family metal-dependent hydrolase